MNCPFCSEVAEPSYGKLLLGEGWPHRDRVLFRSRYAWVVAGLGPQVYPYSLIITTRHCPSFAQTSSVERESIFECLRWLHQLPSYLGPAVSVFEHGSTNGIGCACIDHFHLHAIHGRYPMQDWLVEDEASAVSGVIGSSDCLNVTNGYLLAGRFFGGDVLHATIVAGSPGYSQYFRRLLAGRLRLATWDWRSMINNDYILQIMSESQASRTTIPIPDNKKS